MSRSFGLKKLEKVLSCLTWWLRKVGPTALSDLLTVSMLTLIQHVINDSFASFLRRKVGCVGVLISISLQEDWRPITPATRRTGSGQSPAEFLSWGLHWAGKSLFIQGQLPCDGCAAWLMPQRRQPWRASRSAEACVVPACGPVFPSASGPSFPLDTDPESTF